jgi:hypothetical protein
VRCVHKHECVCGTALDVGLGGSLGTDSPGAVRGFLCLMMGHLYSTAHCVHVFPWICFSGAKGGSCLGLVTCIEADVASCSRGRFDSRGVVVERWFSRFGGRNVTHGHEFPRVLQLGL